jgi:hypothetical protein
VTKLAVSHINACAKEKDRTATTAPGCAAMQAKLEREVDSDGVMSDATEPEPPRICARPNSCSWLRECQGPKQWAKLKQDAAVTRAAKKALRAR